MNTLKEIIAELLGLFVEDITFAVALIIWILAALFLLPHFGLSTGAQATIWVAGLAVVLFENVVRQARSRGKF